MPITEKEWLEARRDCKVGDKLRVFNHWREDLKAKQTKEGKGRWEKSRIRQKFPFIVVLENGRAVDYAEVAMQRRYLKSLSGSAGRRDTNG